MNFYLTVITIFLSSLLAKVDTKFYLEKIDEVLINDWFKDQTGRDPEGFNLSLQACDIIRDTTFPTGHATRCETLETPEDQVKVYEYVNFVAVLDLELYQGSTIVIDGDEFLSVEILDRVRTLGTDPRAYLRPNFQPACKNLQYICDNAFQLLDHFIDQKDERAMARLLQFLSINNIDYFLRAWTADTPELFESFAAVLKRVLDACRYVPEQEIRKKIRQESKSTSKTSCKPRFLFRMITGASFKLKSISKSVPNFVSRLKSWPASRSFGWSQSRLRPRSMSNPHFWPSSPPQPQSQPPSPPQPRSRSSSPPQPQCQPISPPQSPSPSQPPTPAPRSLWFKSRPSLEPLPSLPPMSPLILPPAALDSGDNTVLKAATYLSQKMFDPCFVLNLGDEEKAQARSICTIYCKFASMMIDIYGPYSERCKYLQVGECVNKMCVCGTRGVPKRSVNMVFCNNAFRAYLNDIAAQ